MSEPTTPQQSAPATQSTVATQRRILGIQPVLFVGMCLLAIVTVITVVLIFVGDFESQAPRVVWTVLVFLGFTGLLALDLVLARRSPIPLVIGVVANTYLLAVLMIAIWVHRVDDEWMEGGWLFARLLSVVLLTILVVRAAAAGAWGLINLGKASGTQFGRVLGMAAAVLLGLVGVLLTAHYVFDAFGIDLDNLYWQTTVAAIVVTALACSITVLLFWNRRNLEWQEAEARGDHAREREAREARVAAPQAQSPLQTPPQELHGGVPAGVPGAAQPGVPPVAQPTYPAAAPPAQGGLLPWPTYADGTPYPMGPDGQPLFSGHYPGSYPPPR